jgi:hypothetical protein
LRAAFYLERSKKMNKIPVIAIIAATSLMGCVPSPREMATAPISIDSPKGKISCQLFSAESTLWDMAISYPKGVAQKDADEACRAEGKRRQGG